MRNGNYILVKAPDNYPGKKYRGKYAYEHRLVWWQNTGHLVDSYNENIHHKNENTHDNRFENLKLTTRSRHVSSHAKPKKLIQLICTYCGETFIRENRNYEYKINRGQKRFYCCKEHCNKDILPPPGRFGKKYGKTEINKVLHRAKNGESSYKIAKDFPFSRSTVQRIIQYN